MINLPLVSDITNIRIVEKLKNVWDGVGITG